MSEKDYVLSPQQKEKLAPFMAYLSPERTGDKKELVINQPGEVAYEDFMGNWTYVSAPELNNQVLTDVMALLAEINNIDFLLENPILSLRLPGGHRAQIVAGAQNTRKFSMAVRIHQVRTFGLDDFQMTDADKAAIINAVQTKKTLLISGGTGTGKTSFMNAILPAVGENERIVTLEDVRELKVQQRNVCMFTFANSGKRSDSPSVTDILNACLRMRPDRILLGEIRQENAFTFCSAINTGHAGSMATIHANDPKSALDAVINRIMLNGDVSETAIAVLRRQLINDIYGVVQLDRTKGGVRGYFQVLDPSRYEREKREAVERQAQNRTAAQQK